MKRLILLLSVLFLPVLANAVSEEYIRVLCIPESNHFSVKTEWHEGLRNISGKINEISDEKQQKQIQDKYGIYPANKFDYTCKLPKATYRIFGDKPPATLGMCGSAPQAKLTLIRNEEIVLEDVLITRSCFEALPKSNSRYPYIDSIVINEFIEGFGGSSKVFISNKENKHDLFQINEHYKTDTKYLNQNILNCMMQKSKSANNKLYKECLSVKEKN